MAKILDKEVVRESTLKFDDNNIIISLTEDQKVELRLKNTKDTTLSVSIEDLYDKLLNPVKGKPTKIKVEPKVLTVEDTYPLISITEFRALNAISAIDLKTKVHVDSILASLIEKNKNIVK